VETGDQTATNRMRLAAVERELARLRYRHDIAMSAFRFEEATALGPAIAALEQRLQALAAALPDGEPETGIVPALAQPRRRGRTAAGGTRAAAQWRRK
jgi:hypothetical protein